MRGRYSNELLRAKNAGIPCPWKLGDKEGFYQLRAVKLDQIAKDLTFTRREVAVLTTIINDFMNSVAHYSCFASAKKIADKCGCSTRTVWRAIGKGERAGYIVTKRERRPGNKAYASTHIGLTPPKRVAPKSNIDPAKTDNNSGYEDYGKVSGRKMIVTRNSPVANALEAHGKGISFNGRKTALADITDVMTAYGRSRTETLIRLYNNDTVANDVFMRTQTTAPSMQTR
jgi:helix-turn-helix protein